MKAYDFIVVGTGIAGLLSALKSSEKGNVLLISKSKLINSNTYHAQGGVAAALSPSDNFNKHIQDTLVAGHYKNDKKAVKYIVEHAPEAINILEKYGVKFARAAGSYDLKREGGHGMNRIAFHDDIIGRHIVEVLSRRVKSNKKITVFENTFVVDALISGKTCIGVQIIKNNKCHNISGRRVILATGGLGQIYEKTTNPEVATGDGVAIGYRAGCKIKDLGYVQFHPTALDIPHTQKRLFLLSETLRGEGAILLNKNFVRFMSKAHPLAELAPRDILSEHIGKESQKGKVYLDLRHIKQDIIRKKYPAIYKHLRSLGLDPAKDLLPIVPVAHYSCGGLVTNLNGETSIKNLYAVGEVAHTGLHGTNRLASNSLLEAVVVSQNITKRPLPEKNTAISAKHKIKTPDIQSSHTSLESIRKKIKHTMSKYAVPNPTPKNLHQAVKELNQIKIPKIFSKDVIETANMLTVAKLIIRHHEKKKL